MKQTLHEIIPLTKKDCFYIVERHKSEFLFPLHSHEECELNFIQNGRGVRRLVGDSVEEIGDYELTLVAGEGLEHAWEQGNCNEKDIREITIQFSHDVFSGGLMDRTQFVSIRKMLDKASRGLTFSMNAIMKVYSTLDELASMSESFEQFLAVLKILYELSLDTDARTLSSSSFAEAESEKITSRRIARVQDYVNEHYAESVTLENVASLVGMSPSSFSRFFKKRTGRGFAEYLIDIRLGIAARMLVDTTRGVSEICYASGFNNLSNFNRAFRTRRGYSPREFRALFTKNQVVV